MIDKQHVSNEEKYLVLTQKYLFVMDLTFPVLMIVHTNPLISRRVTVLGIYWKDLFKFWDINQKTKSRFLS